MYVYFLHLIFACLKLCMYGDGILEVYILFPTNLYAGSECTVHVFS